MELGLEARILPSIRVCCLVPMFSRCCGARTHQSEHRQVFQDQEKKIAAVQKPRGSFLEIKKKRTTPPEKKKQADRTKPYPTEPRMDEKGYSTLLLSYSFCFSIPINISQSATYFAPITVSGTFCFKWSVLDTSQSC